MIYIVIFMVLLLVELLYFRIADKFNIIDKPNERSSHSLVTLRGGGIIFYFAVLIFFCVSGFQYPWFFIGLTLLSAISFLDDIVNVSNKIRLLVHFTSVLLFAYQLSLFDMSWYYLIVAFILAVGVVNAYNFMDGINGITVCYSLSVFSLLIFINAKIQFVNQDLLIYTILSLLVFAFFNFRVVAKCFAGDVGSVALAFILIFALGSLILKTGNVIYILFLAVYGVDAIWTIIRRLYLGENIFEAHRSHLYQILANESGVNRLLISFLYGLLQFGIGCLVLFFSNKAVGLQIGFSIVLLVILSMAYLIIKNYLINKYILRLP